MPLDLLGVGFLTLANAKQYQVSLKSLIHVLLQI